MSIPTKAELLDKDVAHQEALVKLLIPEGPHIVKHVIPGGKTMLSSIDKTDMATAVYNWLRRCGSFRELKLSLAKNPDNYEVNIIRVRSFDATGTKPIWERTEKGRKDLAKLLAEIINTHRFVYLHCKPDGIYVAQDKKNKFGPYVTTKEAGVITEDWEPYLEFHPANRSRYSNYPRRNKT